AEKQGIDPRRIYNVSIMPCTAKKFEAERPEMAIDGIPNIDAVLTTRELARLIRTRGLNLHTLEPEGADTPFGERSSAGKLFGVSGGVMEAALRTAYFKLTGQELAIERIKPLRGLDGIKEFHVNIAGMEIGVAAVSGLGNARKLLEQIKKGRNDLHFIEVMTCPGGCINGGGQPYTADPDRIRARMKALYEIDRDAKVRTSHGNKDIQRLYSDYLEKPLSHKSHKLLHTNYTNRKS
ncbi:MAG: [Fe-Fe] hydrogenase large subunit C-terminal domain-containing protein, partial [Candidatus Neomarinimicrobiota bacterium]